MSERQMVTVEVVSFFDYASNAAFFDCALIDGIEWLQAKLKQIPEEFRASASLRIQTDYDESRVGLSIHYERPETDAEMAMRLVSVEKQASNARATDLEHAARLLFKHGIKIEIPGWGSVG